MRYRKNLRTLPKYRAVCRR